ncbi:M16 family metallopeptidase [Streptomyces angustmyceticus]|uniref:M16 family metallopeptidase n=1 Tax=Streptomyces angustmyceticus TaxID=285578 RepID=UPI0038123F2B
MLPTDEVAPVIRRESPEGRQVLVIPAEDALLVSVVLPTGTRDRGPDEARALELLGRVLPAAPVDGEGTGLNAWLARRGAAAEAVIARESVTLRCRMPADGVAECLPVFLAAIVRPTLTDALCRAARDESAAAYAATDTAGRRARDRLRELLFGAHPLGRPSGGAADVPGWQAAALRALYQDLLAGGAPVLVLAGPETAVPAALDGLAAGLPPLSADGCRASRREAPGGEVPSSGGVNLRAEDGGPRARVAAGGQGPARTDASAPAFAVLAELCGASEGSLLRRTLSTDLAVDCSLDAQYVGYSDSGLVRLELELATDDVALTESVLREVLELLAGGGLQETALLTAREAAHARARAEAADPALGSYRAAMRLIDGEGGDARSEWAQRLSQVTAADVARAARAVLRTYAVAVV